MVEEKVPFPEVVHTCPEAPTLDPLRLIEVAVAQIVWLGPASIVAAASVMIRLSLTALQSPLPVLVSLMITDPAARSAALRMYLVERDVVDKNVPVPKELHTCPVAPDTVPLRLIVSEAQVTWLAPASTTGNAWKITFIVSFTSGHGPESWLDKRRIADPAALSAALGVYTAESVLNGAMVPVTAGNLDQITFVTLVDVPRRFTDVVLAQTVWLTPALMDLFTTATTTLSLTGAAQVPFPVETSRNTICERFLSAALSV